jgi:hypothetical protein
MRILSFLALAVLPLAVGCFNDPIERVLAGQDDPYARVQRGGRPKTQREKIADAVAARGGRLIIDREKEDQPVLLADLHYFKSPGKVLDAVAPLSRLTILAVFNTDFSDADMQRLRGLPELTTLNLSSTRITDNGMAALATVPKLHTLFLNNTSVGNAGLRHIAGLTNLHVLELSKTSVTDDGLASLAGLTMMEKLVLGGRGITDKGLVHLKQMRRLRKLTLAGARVTDDGVRDLYATIPHLHILR